MENNGLAIFENEQFGTVRGTIIDGEAWFVATDVASALGYEKPNNAINAHCKKINKFSYPDSGQPAQPYNIIPISDVLRLVMRSNLPKAVDFQDWVVEEVLPAILKTGIYDPTGKRTLTTKDKVEFLEKILTIASKHGCYRALAVNELILHDTGCDILEESGQNIISALGKPEYTPKQLAKILGHGLSDMAIDLALTEMGLQVYGFNEYHLTEKGSKYGAVFNVKSSRKFKHIANIKWHPVIIDKLRMHFRLDSTKALEQDGDSHFRMLLHMKTDAR